MGNGEGGGSALQRFVHKLTRKKEVGDAGSTQLQRCLGVCDLIMMGIGGMVGSGIYFLVGQTAKQQAGKKRQCSNMTHRASRL